MEKLRCTPCSVLGIRTELFLLQTVAAIDWPKETKDLPLTDLRKPKMRPKVILRSLQELARRSAGSYNPVPDHHSPNCECLQATWLLMRGGVTLLLIFPSKKVWNRCDQPSKSSWPSICTTCSSPEGCTFVIHESTFPQAMWSLKLK